ncbi:DNA topoisomerase IB [Nitriliruptoraceae bacterium ZYF776]|nr:DNA topoisomerase IB [Profundirhabdus halotolerans]
MVPARPRQPRRTGRRRPPGPSPSGHGRPRPTVRSTAGGHVRRDGGDRSSRVVPSRGARTLAADPALAAAVAAVPPDHPEEAAEAAGLVHVSDDEPGYRRRRCGRGFTYLDTEGATLPDGPERDRVRALVIPPAWTDVWICRDPDGHLQATGRDERGRKQYRYHDRWREVRDAAKFHRLADFGGHLPTIRRRVDELLRRRCLDRERVLGIVVALLDESLIRIGNDAYLQDNGTYGLTTLTAEQVETVTGRVTFRFVGKGGREHEIDVEDRRLAAAVSRCEELPGQCLFSFTDDDGEVLPLESGHVNTWLRELTGGDFSAKDFRTWGGTVVAATTLAELGPATSAATAKHHELAALDAAAERLGNTRAVARSGYVHPAVLAAPGSPALLEAFRAARPRRFLAREEVAVLRLLEAATEGS